MANKPNKLLTTLSAIGIATAVGASDAKAVTTYDSFGEFFSFSAASFRGDLQAKVDFVRAYPQSPAAQRMARSIARDLASMSPTQQRAAMDQMAATGGLPASVSNAMEMANLGTSSIGRSSQSRGVGADRSRTSGWANSSIY